MPISTDMGLGLFTNTFGGFFGNSLKSPFWVALIITVIIILIILFVYPAKKSSSISKLFKLMIYIFATTLVFLFLHDSAIGECWKKENDDAQQRAAIGGMSDFINSGGRSTMQFGGENKPPIMADPRIGGSNLIAAP